MVRSEEQRRNTMLRNTIDLSMAMVAKYSLIRNRNYYLRTRNNGEKGCAHCGNPKYGVENYFKLHGCLDWWDGLNEKKFQELRNRRKVKRMREKLLQWCHQALYCQLLEPHH